VSEKQMGLYSCVPMCTSICGTTVINVALGLWLVGRLFPRESWFAHY